MNTTQLNHLFEYYAETGILRWKQRPASDFISVRLWKMWNTKFAGKIAGCKQYDGGKPHCIRISMIRSGVQRHYVAHRIIWRMLGLLVPKGKTIDHRDGNPFNNRVWNLRCAWPAQQASNKSVSISVRTHKLPKGVIPSGNKDGRAFRAVVKSHGKRHYAGSFTTIAKAKAARDAAAFIHHGEFAKS